MEMAERCTELKSGVYTVEGDHPHTLRALCVEVEPTASAFALAARAAAVHMLAGGLDASVIGHRAVFGGPAICPRSRRRSSSIALKAWRNLIRYTRPARSRVWAKRCGRFPDGQHVVSFNAALFGEMPDVPRRLPIQVGDDKVLHRYGFLGLSYNYVSRALGDELCALAIIAHLGSGASLAALRDGRPIDTTMGFSLGGEGDLRLLRDQNDDRARAAVNAFVRSVVKAVGALTATLGGLDSLVFTGGVGEHLPEIRGRVMRALDHLGVSIDEEANAVSADVISGPSSRVVVRVVATDENATIARQAVQVVRVHR